MTAPNLNDPAERAAYRRELQGVARPIRSGIVGATPPVVDGRELMRLHGELEKEGIVCAPREGMLRFSPHFYNDLSEVTRAVDVLRELGRQPSTVNRHP